MSASRQIKLPMIVWVLAMGVVFVVEPETSSGQEMKRNSGAMSRSAGSTARSTGERQGNSLGESRRGATATMKSERTKSKSKSTDDKWGDKDRDKDRDKKRGTPTREPLQLD